MKHREPGRSSGVAGGKGGDPGEGSPPGRRKVDRRSFLAGGASLVALGTTAFLYRMAGAAESEGETDPMPRRGTGEPPRPNVSAVPWVQPDAMGVSFGGSF